MSYIQPHVRTPAQQAFESGQAAWPGVSFAESEFTRHLESAGIGNDVLEAQGADLFLAAACGAGQPVALKHFETAFLSKVPQYVARLHFDPHDQDELVQRLRLHLLVGPSPRIREYKGSGPLGAWVRVCAVRLGLRLKQVSPGGAASDQGALETLVTGGASPEETVVKAQHRDQFRAALDEAFLRLGAREKTLLRMHFVDGMNIEEMGAVFRVHRATVARWLVAVRRDILEHVKEHVTTTVRTRSSEFHSLVELVRSDMNISLSRIFGGPR